MSIGIYNGYILPKMSMEEMISFSKKHKENIRNSRSRILH